eukprot:248397_1
MSTLFCDGQQYSHIFIIGLMIHTLGALISIIALFYYIVSITNKNSAPSRIRPMFKWILIVSSIVCITMSIFGTLSFITCYVNKFSLSRVCRTLFLFSMLCNSTILIFSLILRIYQTFENSVYKMQHKLYIILCISFGIGVSLCIIASILNQAFLYSNKIFVQIGLLMNGIGFILIISVWFIVMFLFVKKLALLSIESRQWQNEPSSNSNINRAGRAMSISKSISVVSNKHKKRLERKEKEKIILVATRHVVLNGYVVIHTIVSVIVIMTVWTGPYDIKTVQILGNLMVIFGLVNFLAVYLQYDFTTKLYSKLCFIMDLCCYAMFDTCIDIKIGNNNTNDEKTMTEIQKCDTEIVSSGNEISNVESI